MKEYKKIASLDFELFNTKYYWSVCWVGMVICDLDFNVLTQFEAIMNPGVKESFFGDRITMPFTYKDIRRHPRFNYYSDKILKNIDSDTLVLGHAFDNDARMLIDVCKKYKTPLPSFDFVDTNIIRNAAKSSLGDHSLKSLANEIGFEYMAHNPLEDAKAALKVAKVCVGSGNINSFLSEHSITVGGVYNGVLKRCDAKVYTDVQRQRILNFNKICNTVQRVGQGKGKAVFIDQSIAAESDVSELVERLLNDGYRITSSHYVADIIITNNLLLKSDARTVPLKNILAKYGLPFDAFRFEPKKIRDENNKPISLTEYYKRALYSYSKPGILSGKTVSFSKGSEKRLEYDNTIKNIVSQGGDISLMVDQSNYFVVEKLDDLETNVSDNKIRAYKNAKEPKPKITEFDKLKSYLNGETEALE